MKRFKAAENGHQRVLEVSRNALSKYTNFIRHKCVNSYSKLRKWEISEMSQNSKQLHAHLLNVLNNVI